MARFEALRPMLWTSKLEESIEFYTKRLGFTCPDSSVEDGWASLYKDEVEIMLARPNEHMPFQKEIFTGSFYITTEDVDELWEVVKDVTNICYPIENFEYGMREFAIYDNNGYILQFGKEINR